MTFSLAIDCKTRGVPYIAPKQLDIDDTYTPANNNTPRRNVVFKYLVEKNNKRNVQINKPKSSRLTGCGYLSCNSVVRKQRRSGAGAP